ncbi:hypothetical protein RSSM_01879 [Rhodopirellula sallentina SM41]|uniref:Uncharacterized protein n=1 Tax=Rhodopirellula sallentina SM41 TaxID=1263870 RepID=M5U5H3_9BACT|nr:hypothetical protein RSSM_01879 [Rhodopirellula sallentina SM41]
MHTTLRWLDAFRQLSIGVFAPRVILRPGFHQSICPSGDNLPHFLHKFRKEFVVSIPSVSISNRFDNSFAARRFTR